MSEKKRRNYLQDLLEFSRGAGMGATTDVLGYPVDLMTMALRPFGYKVPDAQVTGSSDWLANQVTSPTGSLPETAGRTLVGLVSPGPEDLMRMAGLLKRAPVNELTTYHGSPHRINNVDEANPLGKFDLSKVGTGEGAQAYGHGIYLAESPDVAKTYTGPISYGYLNADGSAFHAADGYEQAALNLVSQNGTAEKALKAYAKQFARNPDNPLIGSLKKMATLGVHVGKESGGHFYTVDLPDEHIAKMLDWDAPLSEQPKNVQEALAAVDPDFYKPGSPDYDPMETGQMIYQRILHDRRNNAIARGANADTTLPASQAKASEWLRSLGIPGIKYFDQGSRAAGEGTRNFVIFDPDIAKILKRE